MKLKATVCTFALGAAFVFAAAAGSTNATPTTSQTAVVSRVNAETDNLTQCQLDAYELCMRRTGDHLQCLADASMITVC